MLARGRHGVLFNLKKQMLIQAYQRSWEHDFQQIKEILEENIVIDDLTIEHVGSTSVKGLAAKPIIDIDIVYKKTASFHEIKRGLEALDYYHNGNQGIVGREVFKRNKKDRNHVILDAITHHLYVCHIDSEELRKHLIFRDYLRENQQAREAYERLKYEIAEIVNQDRKAYAKLKEIKARTFVESVLAKGGR